MMEYGKMYLRWQCFLSLPIKERLNTFSAEFMLDLTKERIKKFGVWEPGRGRKYYLVTGDNLDIVEALSHLIEIRK